MAAQYYDRIVKLPKATLKDWFYLGYSNYFQYANLVKQNSTNSDLLRKTLLDADSAFTYVAKTAKTNVDSYLYLARVEYYLNPVSENEKVKNAYDQVVTITMSKTTEQTAVDKRNLVEAYSSLGAFYIKSDKIKSKEYFEKALILEPNNQQLRDALASLKASKP
jgi:hypothetical protein